MATESIPGPPDGAAPHLIVDDVDAPTLDDDAAHHLVRVRRIRSGAAVSVTDGAGQWRWCRLADDGSLAVDGEVVVVPRPDPPITVAFGLTKGTKADLTIQKLTELGVDRIIPFRAGRSVVRWDEAKAERTRRRWVAISRSAVEQSSGCHLPMIDQLADVPALATMSAHRLDRGGIAPSLAHSVVAVGAEGGWDDAERDLLPQAVGLGPLVLRAETAALTIGAILCSLRSGIVGSGGEKVDGA